MTEKAKKLGEEPAFPVVRPDIGGIESTGLTKRECNMEYMAREGYVPDYPNDLNAMAEAEKCIVEAGSCYTHYVSELQRMTEHNEWRATAAQRAEAFLRVIGKWKE